MEENPTSEDPLLESWLKRFQNSIDLAADPTSSEQALDISSTASGVRLLFPAQRLTGIDRDRVLRMHWNAAKRMRGKDPEVALCRHDILQRAIKIVLRSAKIPAHNQYINAP